LNACKSLRGEVLENHSSSPSQGFGVTSGCSSWAFVFGYALLLPRTSRLEYTLSSMIDADALNRNGLKLFQCGHFRKAHDCFQSALRSLDAAALPELYFDINYNLAKTLQARGEHRKAIKVFEALRAADPRRYSRYDYGIASSNYKLGHYRCSLQQFVRITEKYRNQRKDFFYYACKLGIANCHAMLKEYREALQLLRSLLTEDSANSAIYMKEIELLRTILADELFFRSEAGPHTLTMSLTPQRQAAEIKIEGDLLLCEIVSAIIPKFPEIRRPIKALYVKQQENNPVGLKKFGISTSFVPISQSHREPSGHVLLYNKDFWSGACESALRGNLAHELMHRAWEDSGADRVFFLWTKDTLSYGCLERIIDHCVLAKGFVEDLFAAKQYMKAKSSGDRSFDLELQELSRFLLAASHFEMAGTGSNLTKIEIPESIADQINRYAMPAEQNNPGREDAEPT